MWVRKRIDIKWIDLVKALWWSIFADDQPFRQEELEAAWDDGVLACLSVRSGFDLLLNELELPKGSEILVSGVTIPDMVRIIERHQLVAVPIDLHIGTMAPNLDQLRNRITPRTKAVVIAHLFGGVIDLSTYAEVSRQHKLFLIEDCAQAFAGERYKGHPDADVVMFSFGPIKTATALGGGIVTIRDSDLLERMRAKQRTYPMQERKPFFKRVLQNSVLKCVGTKPVFSLLVKLWQLQGKDYTELLNRAVRNFPESDFFNHLRQQPSAPLCRLMRWRIETFDTDRLRQRIVLGTRLKEMLSNKFVCPSSELPFHTFWVFPVELQRSEERLRSLRQAGFDIAESSQLKAIQAPPDQPEWTASNANASLANSVYLPFYPELPIDEIERMAQLIEELES